MARERDYAHTLVAAAARDLDLVVDHDAAANTYMTLPGRDRGAPAVIIGLASRFRPKWRKLRWRGGRYCRTGGLGGAEIVGCRADLAISL